jgi:hypothetical protein
MERDNEKKLRAREKGGKASASDRHPEIVE